MSEKQKAGAARLHYFAAGHLIKALKQGFLPMEPGAPLAAPFAQFDRWQSDRSRPVTFEALEAEWQRQYAAMPESVKGLLSYEHFRAQGGAIEADVRAAAKRRQSGGLPHYDQGWLGQGRVLRLFPSALSYYGWRWLADDFSGIAVVVNGASTALKSDRERPSVLAPVVYGAEHRFKVSSRNPFPGLLEDHGSQRDNREWRLLMPAKTTPRREGQPVLPITRDLVKGLTWSVSTPAALVEEIRHLVKHDMRYRSVELARVIPDAQRWQLKLEPDS